MSDDLTPSNQEQLSAPSQPKAKKSRRGLQSLLGIIFGLLSLFIITWPLFLGLRKWLSASQAIIPGLIISTLLSFILFLITRRKLPLFAYLYLLFSYAILGFIVYLLLNFNFT